MRRLVVLVILVALSFTLVACGGGDEEAEAPAAAPAPTPTAASSDDEDESPDLSPGEEQIYEPFPGDEEVIPSSIADRLESGNAMLVYFYDDSQSTADSQTEIVDTVVADYRGLIDLVSFNIGKYVDTSEDGVMTIKEDMEDDETAKQVARLVSDAYLDVRFTPYIVLVDEDGYIVYRFRGPVDEKTLEREVLRTTS